MKFLYPSFEMRLHVSHSIRFLFISLQISPKLFKTELSALFVPGPDLQRVHEWETVGSRKVTAFSLQTCSQFTLQHSEAQLCAQSNRGRQGLGAMGTGVDSREDGFQLWPKHGTEQWCGLFSFQHWDSWPRNRTQNHVTQRYMLWMSNSMTLLPILLYVQSRERANEGSLRRWVTVTSPFLRLASSSAFSTNL